MGTLKKVLVALLAVTSMAFTGCELLDSTGSGVGNSLTSQDSNAEGDDSSVLDDDSEKEPSIEEEIIEAFSYREENGVLTVVGIVGETDGILVIPDEYEGKPVVHIADDVFRHSDTLTSVTIGSNVQTIGKGAFASSSQLTSVIFGSNVQTIGEGAFLECSQLTSVVLGENVETLGDYAFYFCSQLTSIILPDSLREIGEHVFFYCEGLTIYCQAESKPDAWDTEWNNFWDEYSYCPCPVVWDCNNNDVADDGFVYAVVEGVRYALKDQKAIVTRQATGIKNAVIRSSVEYKGVNYSVEEIRATAFAGTAVESVTIPDCIVTIGVEAFYQCSQLKSVVIPVGVLFIGNNAFGGNDLIVYCEAESKPSGWDSEWTNGAIVWHYKNNDEADDGYIYVKIDGLRYALKDGEAKLIEQENDIVEARVAFVIEYQGAQYFVTDFDSTAFRGCSELKRIQFPETVINQEIYQYEIVDYMFSGCSSLESITIPNGLTRVGKSAFQGCNSLTSINLPEGVTSIGADAFRGCSSLTTINLPNAVMSIGPSAFDDCNRLTSVDIPDGVTSIETYTFNGCTRLTSIDIPDSITNIGAYAFNGCSSLEEFLLPDYVEGIGVGAFENTGYYNNQDNWEDDVLYIGKYLIQAQTSIAGDCIVKTGTMTLADYAFNNCRGLGSILLSDSVKYIGEGAFKGCFNLETVELPNSITKIGDWAFASTWLRNINIPHSVTSIGIGAFSNSGLQSFVFPQGVVEVSARIFSGCSNLSSVLIHNKVTSIGEGAFIHCVSLTNIKIPNSVTFIDANAFQNCFALTIYCEVESKPIDWESEWNFIGFSMPPKIYCPVVWDCDNNNVADDGFVYMVSNGIRYALKDGKATVVQQALNIKEAWIAKSVTYNNTECAVTSIESAAFTNCEIVRFVVIPDSVTEIGASAFRFSEVFAAGQLPVKIFCEAESQPNGWAEDWHDSQYVVYWQSKDWHYVNGEIVVLN